MGIDVKELLETIEINRKEMSKSAALTNELVIDDIMIGLGYNKKKDSSVKRVYDSGVDWEVIESNKAKLSVKVLALGESLDNCEETCKEAFDLSADRYFSLMIVTNAEALKLYRYNKHTSKYVHVKTIELNETINSNNDDIALIKAISKSTYDLSVIDEYLTPSVSYDSIREAINNNLNKIAETINSLLAENEQTDSSTEQCEKFIESVLNVKEQESKNTQSLDEESEEQSEKIKILELKLSETYNKINEQEKTIADQESKISEHEKTIADKEAKIVEQSAKIEELSNQTSETPSSSGASAEDILKYREKIEKLSNEVATERKRANELDAKLKKTEEELRNMSGADRKYAQDLIAVIDDSPELDRHYVGVINKELIQFEEIHTFVGRALQRLYEIKSFEASQYIFNGDIFKLVQPATRNDLIMNNKAYDINLDGEHEDIVLNKLRIVFSHFDDVIFECRKIGTLRDKTEEIESNDDEIEIDIDNDDEISDEIDIDTDDEISDIDTDDDETISDEIDMDNDDEIDIENDDETISDEIDIDNDDEISDTDEQFIDEDSDAFGTDDEGFDISDESESDDDFEITDENDDSAFNFEDGNTGSDEETFEISDDSDDSAFNFEDENTESEDETSDWGEGVGEEVDWGEDVGEEVIDWGDENTDNFTGESVHKLLVGQLLEIDNLIWTDEPVTFNTIKYVGSNSMTYNINVNLDNLSNEQLLFRCIDAVLAIEAHGNTNIVAMLKQKDLSKINNFIKLYTDEYKEYPRINGTKYVVVGVESVQQVASILYDVCNALQIDMSELFVYFDADTSSEYIASSYDFPEDAIQLREYTEFDQPGEPKEATAIVKGDMFSRIVVTKNSLKAHKEILLKVQAVKTRYLGKVVNNQSDLVEIVEQMLLESEKANVDIHKINFGAVIGTGYKIISNNENEVGPDALEVHYRNETMYMASLEDWQVVHSLIKIHTSIFNDSAIAIKTIVSADAINFYGEQYETSEPSLSLAVKSFVDYISLNVKEQ